jgi:signal peptidase
MSPSDDPPAPETDGAAAGDDGVGPADGPPSRDVESARTHGDDGPHTHRTDESDEPGFETFVRDLVGSAVAVALVGVLLLAASGVWPPLVVVESTSMVPHLQVGDLVFVMEEQRFAGDAQQESTGVVPARAGGTADHTTFAGPGDVIVYAPDGNFRSTPVIHRAMFYVEAGENWYDRANDSHVQADSCRSLSNCPAPHAGFITKGDNEATNDYYDQARGISKPVKPAWIKGKAVARVPWLGCVRLATEFRGPQCNLLSTAPTPTGTA